MDANKLIMDTLTACGCKPAETPNGEIRINAPEIKTGGTCAECARRDTCKKSIGALFGYCVTDFKRAGVK